MKFSNVKSVSTKFYALLTILKREKRIHYSAECAKIWRLTNPQLGIMATAGYIYLIKQEKNGKSISYLVPGVHFKKVSIDDFKPRGMPIAEFRKTVKKLIAKNGERVEAETPKIHIRNQHIPKAVVATILNSTHWGAEMTLAEKRQSISLIPHTGRIQFPYNSLKKELRVWDFIEFDAHASQPVIFANMLEQVYPNNEFSRIVFGAENVYLAMRDYVDEKGLRAKIKRLATSLKNPKKTANERKEIRKQLDDLGTAFGGGKFDRLALTKDALKTIMMFVLFGGSTYLLKGFPELKQYIKDVRATVDPKNAMRYRKNYFNKGGDPNAKRYNSRKNLSCSLSCDEGLMIMAICEELSAAGIDYLPVHDGIDISKAQFPQASAIIADFLKDMKLENYRFVVKDKK